MDSPLLSNFGLAFVSLFVALDVVGTLPMYVSMTQGLVRKERNRVVNTSVYVAFLVALVFVFLGNAIFRYLGITFSDFKIAGGIVLLLVSLADLVGQPEAEGRTSGSTGVVPLAVPLITGPAVLATLIFQVANFGYGVTLASLACNYLISWIALRYSSVVTRAIGKDGTVVISKVAALLLAAIAISMMRSGLVEAIRSY